MKTDYRRTEPETVRQAQRWDHVKLRYIVAGLCDCCAAQAAWGHQDNAGGWNNLPSPCGDCEIVIQLFPTPTANPLWRKFDRPQNYKRNRAAAVTPEEAVEDIHGQSSDREGALL